MASVESRVDATSSTPPHRDVESKGYRHLSPTNKLTQVSRPLRRNRILSIVLVGILFVSYTFPSFALSSVCHRLFQSHTGHGGARNYDNNRVKDSVAYDPRLEKYRTLDDVKFCVEWNTTGHSIAVASVTLPSSSGLLFLVTRGEPSYGSIRVLKEHGTNPDIEVNVSVEYDDDSQLHAMNACIVGSGGESGVMIHTELASKWKGKNPMVNIIVQLPDMPRFGDLSMDTSGGVYTHDVLTSQEKWYPTMFGTLRIHTANAAISVGAVMTLSSFVETSNANISGAFYVSDRVHLRTSNAPIVSSIWVLDAFSPGNEVKASIETSNGFVDSYFIGATQSERAGVSADLQTTNGALNVTTLRLPESKCRFVINAWTRGAPANVHMSPFEDVRFSLAANTTTGRGEAGVVWDPKMRDGRGRTRTIEMDVNETWNKGGRLFWGEKAPDPAGINDLRVETTDGDAILFV